MILDLSGSKKKTADIAKQVFMPCVKAFQSYERRPVPSFVLLQKFWNKGGYKIFKCIFNTFAFALKLFQKFHEIIIPTQILNEYTFTIMVGRALQFRSMEIVRGCLIIINLL